MKIDAVHDWVHDRDSGSAAKERKKGTAAFSSRAVRWNQPRLEITIVAALLSMNRETTTINPSRYVHADAGSTMNSSTCPIVEARGRDWEL